MATLEKQKPLTFEQPHTETSSQTMHDIGRSGITDQVEVSHVPTPLPEGYEYADASTISDAEIVDLFRKVDIGADTEDSYVQDRAEELKGYGEDIIDVGVRDGETSELVGFGSIAYDGRLGRLGDFIVSPSHQSKGIGRSILLERLAIADAKGVAMLSVHDMEPTNTLRPFYLEQGFNETGDGNLIRITDGRFTAGVEAPPM